MATGGHMHNLTTLIKRYVGSILDFSGSGLCPAILYPIFARLHLMPLTMTDWYTCQQAGSRNLPFGGHGHVA